MDRLHPNVNGQGKQIYFPELKASLELPPDSQEKRKIGEERDESSTDGVTQNSEVTENLEETDKEQSGNSSAVITSRKPVGSNEEQSTGDTEHEAGVIAEMGDEVVDHDYDGAIEEDSYSGAHEDDSDNEGGMESGFEADGTQTTLEATDVSMEDAGGETSVQTVTRKTGKTQRVERYDKFECALCGMAFKGQSYLSAHVRFKHKGYRPHKCPVCHAGFITPSARSRHNVSVHMRQCDKCETYVSEIDPWESGVTSRIPRYVLCGNCENPVVFYSGIRKDIIGGRNDQITTDDWDQLNTAVKVSIQELGSATGETSEAVSNIQAGSQMTTRGKSQGKGPDYKYACSQCKKLFSCTKSVLRHQLSHAAEKTFMCDTCGNVYKTRNCLLVHMKVHSHVTIYPCSLCPKRYRGKTAFVDHMSKKHDVNLKHNEVTCGQVLTVEPDTLPKLEFADGQVLVDGTVAMYAVPTTIEEQELGGV